MPFDPRAAKALVPSEWLLIDDCPGLRLEATKNRRTWTYRYKSKIDGKLHQIKIGPWPAISVGGAIIEWNKHRTARNAGTDPALEKRAAQRTAGKGKRPRRVMLDDTHFAALLLLGDGWLERAIDQACAQKGAK